MTSTPAKNRKRFTPFGIIFTLGGVVLFAYFVRQAGVSQIVEGIRRLGAGFVLILMISGIRHVVRSIAWMMCVEAPHRLRFRDALRARLMGDAIGNILPLGNFIISEPAKPALIRDRLPLMAGFSAMVIENIFYGLSVVTFVLSGMLALLLNFTLPKGLRLASIITVAVIAVMIALGVVLVRKQVKFISGATSLLYRRGLNQKWIEKSRIVEDRVYGFYRKSGWRFLPILLLEACFHLAGVIEIYVTLYFISPQQPPTLFTAFILESVNRVITMAFKFVPLRMGVDEAGTGRVSKILQFTQAAGVTLAIIRKARDVFWACVGVLLLLHRGLNLRAAARDAEFATAEPSVETFTAPESN